MKTVRAYHFVGKTLRNGGPIPADGEWLKVKPPLVMCRRGLHASRCPLDALQYAPGETLCLVDMDGEIIEGNDKLVASRRRIVARFDATKLLREFACNQALSVIHLWNAPPVVREYLTTRDESKRDAAWAAARTAARDAGRDVARDAAWDAARDAGRDVARDAAWDAAWDAGRDVAWDAARDAARDVARAVALGSARGAARKSFREMVESRFSYL